MVQRGIGGTGAGWLSGRRATTGAVVLALALVMAASGARAEDNFVDPCSGFSCTVGGGSTNSAGGDRATVGGGYFNTANGDRATVGGGDTNIANGPGAFVGGGKSNVAEVGAQPTVGGGNTNIASSNQATVAGGMNNIASSSQATVGGGSGNVASGLAATVPGGSSNLAEGDLSFAAGQRAKAQAKGGFVWADSQPFDFPIGLPNRFDARATGGVRFVTAINAATGAPTAGVRVPPGGSAWASVSDRAVKINIQDVDGREILARLVAMPVQRWSYAAQGPSILHLGPMAQDFAAAFGVGEDDRHITTVDADGVALAAIQGLHAMVLEQGATLRTENIALRAQNSTLEAGVAALRNQNTALEARVAALEQPRGLDGTAQPMGSLAGMGWPLLAGVAFGGFGVAGLGIGLGLGLALRLRPGRSG